MPNEIIVAAAGGGKTTRIVRRAAHDPRRAALVTYTINNVQELRSRFYEIGSAMPAHVEIWSWYRFLLHELVRPYQLSLVKRRIDGLHYVEGRSPIAKKTDIGRYFLSGGGRLIYSDKISEFVLMLNDASGGAVAARLAQRFSVIYVDEIQDMAGWDLELLELLLRSGIDIVLVGDHRQATFRTNNSPKNKAFAGVKVIDKFRAWEKAELGKLIFERETHRCHQLIADFADAFFPGEPTTISKNDKDTGHDGVFVIGRPLVEQYVGRFRPQVLRLDRKTDCADYPALNFGDSKGMTFDRVLIFPHKSGQSWLKSGDFKHVAGSVAKLYVGVTRARHSVAFVHDGACALKGAVPFVDVEQPE